MKQWFSEESAVLTRTGYKGLSRLTNKDEVALFNNEGMFVGFSRRFNWTLLPDVQRLYRITFANGYVVEVGEGSVFKRKGSLREVDVKSLKRGDHVKYGGRGSIVENGGEVVRWAWFFGRFVESGYGNKDCYCWNSDYEDVVEWLDKNGVKYSVSKELLCVDEKTVGIRWKVVKECFGEWLWCGDFRDGVGWGLEEVYEGVGEVEKVDVVEGKVVMFESDGKIISRLERTV